MNAAPALVRPTLQTFTLGFGAAPSGRLEGTADIANAHSRRDCKKTVSFGTVLPSACPSASEADAAANWVNAYDERAVVDCHRFRRVTLPAVTAASGRARLGDGDAKRLDEQHTVIAGRWLQTTEYRFPRSTSDDANDSVSPGNVRRNEEAFVVDPEGVVHLAVFVPREERSVDRTACTCACPQCQQQPGGGVPGAYRTIDSQTWYAVPTGTPLGPAVRFAVDVVRAHVARPSNCYGCLCQPPA